VVRQLTYLFSAGAVGGFFNALAIWIFGMAGFSAAAGMPPSGWSPPTIYRQTVWGGIWGVIFVLPVFNRMPALKGILLSLAPTIVAYWYVIPMKMKAVPDFQPGLVLLLYVTLANIVWGLGAAYWLKLLDTPHVK